MVFGYAGRGNEGGPSFPSAVSGADPGGRARHPSSMADRSSANVLTWNSWAPSLWSAYSAARASLNASIASMRFWKTWTRQVRRGTSAEVTRSAIVETSSFMRAETMTFGDPTRVRSSERPGFLGER